MSLPERTLSSIAYSSIRPSNNLSSSGPRDRSPPRRGSSAKPSHPPQQLHSLPSSTPKNAFLPAPTVTSFINYAEIPKVPSSKPTDPLLNVPPEMLSAISSASHHPVGVRSPERDIGHLGDRDSRFVHDSRRSRRLSRSPSPRHSRRSPYRRSRSPHRRSHSPRSHPMRRSRSPKREYSHRERNRKRSNSGRFRDDRPSKYPRQGGFTRIQQAPPDYIIQSGLSESTESYKLSNSKELEAFELAQYTELLPVPAVDPARMLTGDFVTKELVEELWTQKSRMDEVFDAGNSHAYYRQRQALFPTTVSGSDSYSNRAGDKLMQVHQKVDILEGITAPVYFIDICGGPGAFTQMLFSTAPAPCRGFGLTLDVGEWWYPELLNHRDFTILKGKDGTGNVYNPANLVDAARKIKFERAKIKIAVADGGFAASRSSTGDHLENYQELYSSRIILSEFLMMLLVLEENGHFVCKLFDCFTPFMQSLLYLATQLFKEVYIVKPQRSRILNSERYIVGKSLAENNDKRKFILSLLTEIHKNCTDDAIPLSCVPLKYILEDQTFMDATRTMLSEIADRQTRSLKFVMDAVDEQLQSRFIAPQLQSTSDSEPVAPERIAEDRTDKVQPADELTH